MSNQNADPSAVHCKAGVVEAEIIRRKATGKGGFSVFFLEEEEDEEDRIDGEDTGAGQEEKTT